LTLPVNQVLALFNKAMRKVAQHLLGVQEEDIAKSLPAAQSAKKVRLEATDQTLEEDMTEAAAEVNKELNNERAELLNDPSLARFAITGNDEEWNKALKSKKGTPVSMVSIKSADDNRKRKQPNNNKNNKNSKKFKPKKA
jgi:N-acetyltransferase 10